MEAKHTPGPWTDSTPEGYEGFVYIDGPETNNGYVAVLYNTRDEEGHANVRLIKAAPDLLEALEDIEELAHDEQGEWASVDLAYCPERIITLRNIEILARNTIAKAKGE